MPAPFEDEELGVLERRRGRWRAEVLLDGDRVPLTVVGGRKGPDPEALAIARRAPDELDRVRPALDAALTEHREAAEEPLPTDWRIEWASVAPLDRTLVLELGIQTTWDEEHTLGARVRDGALVELNGSVLRP